MSLATLNSKLYACMVDNIDRLSSEPIKAARARIAQLQGALQKHPSSASLDGSVPGGLSVLNGSQGLGLGA